MNIDTVTQHNEHPQLTDTRAQTSFSELCTQKYASNNLIEKSPEDVFKRLASFLATIELSKSKRRIWAEKFYNELLKLDPKVKNFIPKSDSQRSIRAYEVKKFTKKFESYNFEMLFIRRTGIFYIFPFFCPWEN